MYLYGFKWTREAKAMLRHSQQIVLELKQERRFLVVWSQDSMQWLPGVTGARNTAEPHIDWS